jgi:hypothetical protein
MVKFLENLVSEIISLLLYDKISPKRDRSQWGEIISLDVGDQLRPVPDSLSVAAIEPTVPQVWASSSGNHH